MGKDRYTTLGAKLGPRIAQLIAQANVHHDRQMFDTKHKLAMHVFEAASTMIGTELSAAGGDLLAELAAHPATPPHTARLLTLAAEGKGQGGAITAAQMLGGSAAGSLGLVFSNALYPAVSAIVGRDPHIPPGIEQLAILAARGLVDYGSAQDHAEGQGMGGGWFESLVEGSRAWPDVAVILELWRRGEVGNDEASKLLRRLGMPAEVFGPILNLKRVHLAPADAALGLLRHNLSEGRAKEAAHAAGLTTEDFETLVDNTGEPPALEEMLSLWRRGKISTEKLDRAIRQSRVRNEWIDEVHKMAIIPPSPQEALNALLQGQISEEEARKRFKEGGGDMTWFQHAFDSEGSAPSPVELGDMANRGIIDWNGKGPHRVTFEQGFLEGPWRNKWLEPMRKLAEYKPPPRTLTTLVRDAAISKKQAYKLYREQGLSPELAQAYITSAITDKTLKQRNLAVTQITQLYTDQAIDRGEAMAMLDDLGYDKKEAHFLTVLADLARVHRYTETAISTIHSRYTGHVIERHQASADLDQLQVPASQRNSLLHLWDLEREAKVKLLSEAQVVKAVKKELLSPEQGQHRLEKMGYPQQDAEILLKM